MEFQNIVRTATRLIFAAGGLIFLFLGSFSKLQFQENANWKGMCFIILSLSVAFFVFEPRKCNDMFEKLSDMHFLANAVVKLLLLGLFSMVIFFTKYPGLKIHSQSRDEEQGKRSGKLNDLLSVGSFSVLALVMSWERDQRQQGGAGFGVFEFMLELTMDASMEIPAGDDDGSGPNLWYMLGAYVYCFVLLVIRSHGGYSLILMGHGNGISNSSAAAAYQDEHQLLGMEEGSAGIDIDQQSTSPLRQYSVHHTNGSIMSDNSLENEQEDDQQLLGSTSDGRHASSSALESGNHETAEEENEGNIEFMLDGSQTESNYGRMIERVSYEVEGLRRRLGRSTPHTNIKSRQRRFEDGQIYSFRGWVEEGPLEREIMSNQSSRLYACMGTRTTQTSASGLRRRRGKSMLSLFPLPDGEAGSGDN